MGFTPEDRHTDDDEAIKGGIGKSEMQQGGGRGFGGPGGPPRNEPGSGPRDGLSRRSASRFWATVRIQPRPPAKDH